ncbi:hypothetical protein PILCRDRAFT_820533 [Piloderma croceum F 1598]|uniref:Uncharacterized protein n=1 Tax=Piloderma croceum (strain F 1598) TaxID=765440 RepID=A0A0C3B7F5_PILCF|nr:hypothetical protein PILCRDRAFT_820533 [Piloderma croceum F 1598]
MSHDATDVFYHPAVSSIRLCEPHRSKHRATSHYVTGGNPRRKDQGFIGAAH